MNKSEQIRTAQRQAPRIRGIHFCQRGLVGGAGTVTTMILMPPIVGGPVGVRITGRGDLAIWEQLRVEGSKVACMRNVLFLAVAALMLAGCASGPAGPSLDQQQQAWESEMEEQACESIKGLTPSSLETGWAFRASAAGENYADDMKLMMDAMAADEPYRCSGPVFDRYLGERLVDGFPDSPKGLAGETTKPAPR